MKRNGLIASLLLLSCCFFNQLNAQIKNPVLWKYEAKKNGANYDIIITATIEKPWHIYSQNTGKGGPIPTKITFNSNPLIQIEGTPKETGKLEKVFDKSFNTEVLYYSKTVVFTQKVKLKAAVRTKLSGTIEFMVCDDEQCLPPTKKPFEIKF